MSNETNLAKEEFEKMNIQFRAEMFKENIKQAMKTALFSLNAAFLLNGTGATAMFTKSMNIPAIFCTLGAIIAVICMGVSYLVLLAIADSWRPFFFKKVQYHFLFFNINKYNYDKYIYLCLYGWFTSIFIFIVTVFIVVTPFFDFITKT